MLIEICANSFQSAKVAAEAGADRIELCQSLESGGLTPSAGDIRRAVDLKARFAMKVNVLIRPRNGDFSYGPEDYEVMREDIRYCRDAGADGVVIGALLEDGNIDFAGMTKLVDVAGSNLGLTFHRAFDLCVDPDVALKRLAELGFDRVLTSGRAPTAVLGQENIKRWIDQFGDQLIIMPGSGINAGNIRSLVEYIGAKEVHLSAKGHRESKFKQEQKLFKLDYWETDRELIRAVKEALEKK